MFTAPVSPGVDTGANMDPNLSDAGKQSIAYSMETRGITVALPAWSDSPPKDHWVKLQ